MTSRADFDQFDYNDDDDDDDEEFDNSLERKSTRTPMHSGVYYPRLASQFYQRFSSLGFSTTVSKKFSPSTVMDSCENSRKDTRENTNDSTKKPILDTTTCSSSSRNPVLSTPLLDPCSPSYTESSWDDEEDPDEADHGPKFASPWLREVAVLSWRTVLNAVRMHS